VPADDTVTCGPATETATDPGELDGVTAWIFVSETTLKEVAGSLPNVTLVAPVKLVFGALNNGCHTCYLIARICVRPPRQCLDRMVGQLVGDP